MAFKRSAVRSRLSPPKRCAEHFKSYGNWLIKPIPVTFLFSKILVCHVLNGAIADLLLIVFPH